jgi:diguanylate cyclase (GGDEF)-like protein/PAS domain S-box-containing protein
MTTDYVSHRMINKVRSINPWHYLWISIVLSELLTTIMDFFISSIWWGRIDSDLIFIGDIDAFLVSLIVASIVIYFLKYTARIAAANERLQQEITERKQAEEALESSQKRLKILFDFAPDPSFLLDLEGNILDGNHAAEKMSGYLKNEIVGMNIVTQKLIPASQALKAMASLAKSAMGIPVAPDEYTINRRDGTQIEMEISTYPIKIDREPQVLCIGRDITKRKRMESVLERQAFYDTLTGLPNRALFTTRLQRVARRSSRHKDYFFAVLFMDLDRFKFINDSLGHLTGDQLLVAVAQRLETCVRADDMVARLGGDEFALLLDDIKEIYDATHMADRIQEKLKLPFTLGHQEIFVTASVGIVLSNTANIQEQDLLRCADSAMYRAKARGGGGYEIFDTQMHQSAMKVVELEADLRRAVARMEFILQYQPILSLTTGDIIAIEALIHWRHPTRGLLPPTEFIPLAEETGLIVPIGELFLRTACAKIGVLDAAGYSHIRIAVNFSARQFRDQKVSDLIKSVLQETGIDPQRLDIEITESVTMENHSIQTLNEIGALGVGISVDNFGTGYSSMSALKRFPIDALKIDRSFVGDIMSSSNARAIVAGTVVMAHSLGIRVIAEGVETEEQLEFLRSVHCDEAQGFLLSVPLTDEEMMRAVHCELSLFTLPADKQGTSPELVECIVR